MKDAISRPSLPASVVSYQIPFEKIDDDAKRRSFRAGIKLVRGAYLEKEQEWTVAEANNGRVALERIAEDQPDLILLDLMMPEMDGFEFITELRREEKWRSIPVVVVTAKDVTNEERLRLNSCVENIIQKESYSREELLAEVHNLVATYVRS